MKTVHIVCGIVQTEDGYLIGKRKSAVHDGIWEFPGGKVEANETNEQALVREWQEELAITIEPTAFLCTVRDEREDVTLLVHAWRCIWKSGTLCPRVHHEIRFVAASQLYDYTFEASDRMILDILNHKVRG